MPKKAGHRSWGPKGACVPGTHRGDIMNKETRSKVMRKIRAKDTKPEKRVAELLDNAGIEYDQHIATLPGRPDFAIHPCQVAVFVDGDFWHGWRFPLWQHKLSSRWRTKIQKNRERDQRNFRQMRRRGWKVVRIWEHQIEQDANKCLQRILAAL